MLRLCLSVLRLVLLALLVQVLHCPVADASGYAPSFGQVPSSRDSYSDPNASFNGCMPQSATTITPTRSIFVDVNTLLCRVGRLVRNLLRQLSASQRPIVIVRGLEIVPAKAEESVVAPTDDPLHQGSTRETSLMECFTEYLRTHEMNIKFSDFLMDETKDSEALEANPNGVNVAEGRNKKHKDHDHHGSMLLVSMMFSKMMALMTLGGIGAVAMKALGVAMAALMMSGMHGMKAMLDYSKSKEESHGDHVEHMMHMRRRNLAVAGMLSTPASRIVTLPKPKGNSGSGMGWADSTSSARSSRLIKYTLPLAETQPLSQHTAGINAPPECQPDLFSYCTHRPQPTSHGTHTFKSRKCPDWNE